MNVANVAKSNIGYTEVPYADIKKHSFLRTLCIATVEMFGRKENGCEWGYETYLLKLGVSRSTVWRAFAELKDDENYAIKRVGFERGEVQFKGELKRKKYIRVENWFNTQIFSFTYHDKEGNVTGTAERRLTPAEVAVFSLIYTHWRSGKMFKASYYEMSKTLDLAVETICRAFKELFAAKLIKRPVRGRNRTKNEFTVRRNVFKRYAEAHKKAAKKQAKTVQKEETPQQRAQRQAIENANARAERERYYAVLREHAQHRADRYIMKANENARFKELTGELSIMEIALAKAELFNKDKLPQLMNQKRRLQAERLNILQEMGISEMDLIPQWQCKRCSDTGYCRDGRSCDCYQSRGKPQGDDVQV